MMIKKNRFTVDGNTKHEGYNLTAHYGLWNGYQSVGFTYEQAIKALDILVLTDGLAYELDTKVPKLAEEAMYAHILHSIIATRSGQPEYLVQRLKKESFAKLRNAKIRLSNIKIEEITQVMRGKSKWIKH